MKVKLILLFNHFVFMKLEQELKKEQYFFANQLTITNQIFFEEKNMLILFSENLYTQKQ